MSTDLFGIAVHEQLDGKVKIWEISLIERHPGNCLALSHSDTDWSVTPTRRGVRDP